MSQEKLDAYDDTLEREVVGYGYEHCRFTGPAQTPSGDWQLRIQEEQPSEENWKQTENVTHKLRNITPLAHAKDSSHPNIIGYEITFELSDSKRVTKYITYKPPENRELLRSHPLVPQDPDHNPPESWQLNE